jgi:hypothetical protein
MKRTILVLTAFVAVVCLGMTALTRVMAGEVSSPATAGLDISDINLIPGDPGQVISSSHLYSVSAEGLSEVAKLPGANASASMAVMGSGGVPILAQVEGSEIEVFRLADGWRTLGKLPLPDDSYDAVTMAAVGAVVIVIARSAQSVNFSSGSGYVSVDNGESWSAVSVPAFGNISYANGSFWLVDGATKRKMWSSTDGRVWKDSTPASLPQNASILGSVETAGGAIALAGVDASNGRAPKILAGHPTGAESWSFDEPMKFPSGTHGQPIVSMRKNGSWFASASDGTVITGSSVAAMSGPNGGASRSTGLGTGLVAVTFGDGNAGVAKTVGSDCSAGKSSCVERASLKRTTDGGSTWEEVGE